MEKKDIIRIEGGSPDGPPKGPEDLLNQLFIYSLSVGMEYGKKILEEVNGDPKKATEKLGELTNTLLELLNPVKETPEKK